MREWSVCVVLGRCNSWTHSLKYQNGTVYDFAVYFKKWKRFKCKHLQCAHELVEQPQAVLCQNRHRGGSVPFLFLGNECLGSCTMSWSRKWSLQAFLPSSVQNIFQPDHFLLPAPRAGWVLETQRWTHLQQGWNRFLWEIGYLHQKLGTTSLISAGTHPKCQFFWHLVVRYRECCTLIE